MAETFHVRQTCSPHARRVHRSLAVDIRTPPLGVTCPTCGAPVGTPCIPLRPDPRDRPIR